jgi:hypothetical protein
MASHCTSCGVRLFGSWETDSGLCDRCRDTAFHTSPSRPAPPEPSPGYGPDEPGHPWEDEPRRGREDEPSPFRDEPPFLLPGAGAGEWRTFRSGVQCVRAALLILIIAFVAGFMLGVFTAGSRAAGPLQAGRLAQGLAVLLAGLVLLVGLIQLCGVPRRTGLRSLAWASLCCYLLLILAVGAVVGFTALQVSAAMSRMGGGTGSPGPFGPAASSWELFLLLLGACVILALAGHVCQFLLFSGAARRLGDPSLAAQFMTYLVASIVLPLVLYALMVLLMFGAFSGPGRATSGAFPVILGTFGCLGIAALCMIIWLLTMLSNLARLCEHPRLPPPAFDD